MIIMLKEKIINLKSSYQSLAPEFNNDVQKMQHLVRIIVSVVTEFKALAKSFDDCDEDSDLHISPRTFELYGNFAEGLDTNKPDFYTKEYEQKIQIAINIQIVLCIQDCSDFTTICKKQFCNFVMITFCG